MSNESNREDRRMVSPSELQASDFVPPGTGWNKGESAQCQTDQGSESQDDENAIDGRRPH